MELSRLIIAAISISLCAKATLVEIATKQSEERIRYQSSDGKYTFYQKRDGGLALSQYLKTSEILTNPVGTQYLVLGTKDEKTFLVLVKNNFHQENSIRSNWIIKKYLPEEGIFNDLGEGVGAKFQMDDQWISFYNFYSKKVEIISLANNLLSFGFKVQSAFSSYFVPQVVVLDNNSVIFTDQNEKGESGVVLFTKSEGKFSTLYKNQSPLHKLELCKVKDQIAIGHFPMPSVNSHSIIKTIKVNDIHTKSPVPKTVYRNSFADLGQMKCDKDKVMFIKTHKNDADRRYFETDLVRLDVETQKTQQLTENHKIRRFFIMSGQTYVPLEGKMYMIKEKEE